VFYRWFLVRNQATSYAMKSGLPATRYLPQIWLRLRLSEWNSPSATLFWLFLSKCDNLLIYQPKKPKTVTSRLCKPLFVDCIQSHSLMNCLSVFSPVWRWNCLSKRMRSDSPSIEPRITSEGKFLCEADNRAFDTREDYDRHCSRAHMTNRSW
jgi:hypothetical protein